MIIKGITVKLYEHQQTGTDPFNRPVYEDTPVDVENVLVGQPTEAEVLDTLNLTGRKAIYVLGIPKGDTHDWEDKKVEFWGLTFKTIGMPIQGIEEMVPLSWNKKIRVERYE